MLNPKLSSYVEGEPHLEPLETRLVRVETRLGFMEGDLGEIKSDIKDLKRDVVKHREEMLRGFAKLAMGDVMTRIWMLLSQATLLAVMARGFKWL